MAVDMLIHALITPIITLLGIIGNTSVIGVIMINRNANNVTEFFIFHIAVVDLLTNFTYGIIHSIYSGSREWFLGELLCSVYTASFTFVPITALLLLALLSADRYYNVSMVTKHYMTYRKAVVVVALIWFISAAMTLPILFTSTVGMEIRPTRLSRVNETACFTGSKEGDIPGLTTYHTAVMIGMVVPYAYTIYANTRIICHLVKRRTMYIAPTPINTRTDFSDISRTPRPEPISHVTTRAAYRSSKIVLMIVIVSSVCWGSAFIAPVFATYDDRGTCAVTAVLWSIAYGHTLANPTVFACCNMNFRKEIKKLVCCKNRKERCVIYIHSVAFIVGDSHRPGARSPPGNENTPNLVSSTVP